MSNEIKSIKDEELENVVGGGKGCNPNNGGNGNEVWGHFITTPPACGYEQIAEANLRITDTEELDAEARRGSI